MDLAASRDQGEREDSGSRAPGLETVILLVWTGA